MEVVSLQRQALLEIGYTVVKKSTAEDGTKTAQIIEFQPTSPLVAVRRIIKVLPDIQNTKDETTARELWEMVQAVLEYASAQAGHAGDFNMTALLDGVISNVAIKVQNPTIQGTYM